MFGQYSSTVFPRGTAEINLSCDSLLMSSELNFPLCPLAQLSVAESPIFDSVSDALHSCCGSSSSSSSSGSGSGRGSYCSPSSVATTHHHQKPSSSSSSFMQRSVSSHSLGNGKNYGVHCHFASTLTTDFIDSHSGSVRRVFSTGDLDQGISMGQHHQHGQSRRSESPLSSESNAIIEGMSRACRYSPEEKKERIERYRTKRNLRNFNKKIKYACRKTLADSRPRIRGRFARNEEIEKNPQVEWSHVMNGEDEEEDEENWVNFLDSFSANFINPN